MPPASAVTSREDLIHALLEAAELEHAVTCQYLFAAFSLKKDPSEGGVSWLQLERMRTWQADLLLVARQEMEHLSLVCNLLTAVGGTPHFGRPNFPHPAPYCPALDALELHPLCEAAVERFMHIEQVHGVTTGAEQEIGGATIGDLYRRIREGLVAVDKANEKLFIGPRAVQVSNDTIDLREGRYGMDLQAVVDLQTALQVIDRIVEAGDGAPSEQADSHYRRFERILHELQAMRRADPGFEPARPVSSNPFTRPPREAGRRAVTVIEHPVTRRAAELFDTAYETMLLLLLRFYAPVDETEEEREGLKRLAFFPMMTMVIRPLGEMLTRMPVREDLPDKTAGPGFALHHDLQLHPQKQSAWTVLHERLLQMADTCAGLSRDVASLRAPWAERIHPRLAFLHENLEGMALHFERFMRLKDVYFRHLFNKVLSAR